MWNLDFHLNWKPTQTPTIKQLIYIYRQIITQTFAVKFLKQPIENDQQIYEGMEECKLIHKTFIRVIKKKN